MNIEHRNPKSRGAVPAVLAAMVLAVPLCALAQQGQNQPRAVRTTDHAIQVYISEDALQAQYIRDLDVDELGTTEVKLGVFYNEDRDLLAIGDLLLPVGEVRDQPHRLEFRVGSRVYGAFLANENEDVFGVSVGGEARYFIGQRRSTAVVLSAFYAPDILTFGAADNVADVSLRLETRLNDGTNIFVGYRALEIDVVPVDRELDDNLHIGFRRSF